MVAPTETGQQKHVIRSQGRQLAEGWVQAGRDIESTDDNVKEFLNQPYAVGLHGTDPQRLADLQRVVGDPNGIGQSQLDVFGDWRQEPVRGAEHPQSVVQPFLRDEDVGALGLAQPYALVRGLGLVRPGFGPFEPVVAFKPLGGLQTTEVVVDLQGFAGRELFAVPVVDIAAAVPAAHDFLVDGVEELH